MGHGPRLIVDSDMRLSHRQFDVRVAGQPLNFRKGHAVSQEFCDVRVATGGDLPAHRHVLQHPERGQLPVVLVQGGGRSAAFEAFEVLRLFQVSEIDFDAPPRPVNLLAATVLIL